MTFVFVGAGYAGVEALGELEDLARDAMANYPSLRPQTDAMGTRGGRPQDPAGAARSTSLATPRSGLSAGGSRCCCNTRLASAEGGPMTLSDGQTFEADTLVWTPGVKPAPLAAFSGLPLDDRGRIEVDDRLRVIGVARCMGGR